MSLIDRITGENGKRSRFFFWIRERREYHYDHVPRNHARYEFYELICSLLGMDDIWDSRNQ
jgi:hypothetical protein